MGKLLMRTAGVGPGEIELREGANRIGRSSDNDFAIADASISSSHCVITVSDGSVRVNDLGSTNGTFIDGQPVQEAILLDGQTLRLGTVELGFQAAAGLSLVASPVNGPTASVEPATPPGLSLARKKPAEAAQASPAGQPVESGVKLARQTTPPAIDVPAASSVEHPCRNHPQVQAALLCKQCKSLFCQACVDEQKVGNRIWRLCPTCKGECTSLEEQLAEQERKLVKEGRTFFQDLPGVFKYPFGQGGALLLIFGTFAFCVMDGVMFIIKFFIRYFGIVGLLATLFVLIFVVVTGYGYLFAYMQRIIVASAQDDDRLPDWPEFSEWGSDIVRPFFMLAFTFAACFGPAFGYLVSASGSETDLNQLILFPLIALGFLYFPMALLAVAMADSVAAVNPLVVVPAIMKVPRAYLIACVVFFMVVLVRYLSVTVLARITPAPMLSAIPAGFLALYFLIVEMRLLGLVYYKNRERFGWYRKT